MLNFVKIINRQKIIILNFFQDPGIFYISWLKVEKKDFPVIIVL